MRPAAAPFMSPHDKSYREQAASQRAMYGLMFLADHIREVQVKRLVTTVLSLCLMVPLSVQAEEAKHMLDANTLDNVRKVAPALEKYAQGPLADLWRRPGLAPRDRSIVTVAAMIARNQTADMAGQLERALDNGVKPAEISGIITHLAFYSGWSNAMAATAAAKDVFARRNIGLDQLAAASPPLLALNEAQEANRANRVGQQFGATFPGVVQYTTDVLFRDLWLRPDLAPTRPQPCDDQRPRGCRPDGSAYRPSQPGNGQRADADRGRGSHHAPRLLCRLAQRLLGDAGGQGRLRETAQVARGWPMAGMLEGKVALITGAPAASAAGPRCCSPAKARRSPSPIWPPTASGRRRS